MKDLAYLKLMAREYPTIRAASSEIINLTAIQGLPKGTEYFFSDLHGEHEAFIHLLRSASGVIREKISETFSHILPEKEEVELANLIYYPDRIMNQLELSGQADDDWLRVTIYRLVQICKVVSSKYTRSKVRKKMPPEFAYIIDELLHVDYNDDNKRVYYSEIIRSIIDIRIGDKFIIALCELIQNLTIDCLHIIGDIFDRGPRADMIMNELLQFHDVDIQWGNHDISWMGAATGNLACICNVLRIAISYNSFDVLEDGYGINLRPLSMFAARVYRNDPCERFSPQILDENIYDAVDPGLAAKMHKAIAIIQFKVEGQIIKRHPEYEMNDRILLNAIDYNKGTVTIEGKEYPLLDASFPTIDPASPLTLNEEEEELLRTLQLSFLHNELLHRHVRFLYSHGSMYKCYNSNLLYHGCIPMREDGTFEEICMEGSSYSGKALMDYVDNKIQNAYFLPEHTQESRDARDFMWYLWCGAKSPVYGKGKMTTFEHYFIEDHQTHMEPMNPYYRLSIKEEYCEKILSEFGLSGESAHIINGHVPVKIKEGESPVKAGGRLFLIDGGLSKAYQSKTGIAGYTLIYNSNHLALAEHKPFDPEKESTPKVSVVENMKRRVMVADTDKGAELTGRIEDLKELVAAYREGIIKERIE
ncbi:fructose-1,6-bisphosphatase-3 [Lacrimispora xylanisolvens]|jgi:fructose-1,6-bisphosphatase-3|uniref:Fructose-1,6-bisphosphatase class 3 n=1 Tax=Lacrimispora xylanisolvens TaxID=384636 RepID=A0A2S6HPH5_9FIRM|nr:fructose-1,6-bisphosphatase [Hungatella xylanolytica]MBE5987318.1 fructose-1,6-bisphosphatase [Paenibacillaceae bacterium]PPK79447.1 fructose-1,6-bisphosphatase-3 [Hungatella xylanolytica]